MAAFWVCLLERGAMSIFAETAQLLASEGWRVVRVTHGMSIADAWAQLDSSPRSRPSVSAASLPAMQSGTV